MADAGLSYHSPMHEGRAKAREKSTRERAADLINEGRRLARVALEEETKEGDLVREYGPRIKEPT